MPIALPLEIDYRPHLPAKTDYGIGAIGTGGIVQGAHWPAYRKAGFRVVACYDANHETAQRAAQQFGVPKAHQTLADLLADPAVEIVDVAVPPWEQPKIVEQVAAAGKPMLCQKPLALDYADALRMVEAANRAGVPQAVNQQMRWDAGIRASKHIIQQGWIGQPTDAQLHISVSTPWHLWPWLAAMPRMEVFMHSIHYLDAMRYLFGDPLWLTARHARYAQQEPVKGETKTITILDYADGLQVLVNVNHYNQHAAPLAAFRFLGTEGAITGTVGLIADYPRGRPDTIEITSTHFGKGVKLTPTLDEMWIPDAFVGPMASLMEAVATGGEPQDNSAADNLHTLQLVFAAYKSAAENRSVQPKEIGA